MCQIHSLPATGAYVRLYRQPCWTSFFTINSYPAFAVANAAKN